MAKPERQQQVLDLLKGLHGIEPLKKLFWEELNYQRVNQPLSRRGWTESASKALADDPVLFAGGGENNDFHVIYCRLASDKLILGGERPVVSRLLNDHPYALFVFSNAAQNRWHFLNVKYDETSDKRRLFRRITVGKEERLRTASERISLLSLEAISPELFGLAPLTIQQHHDEAFNVEAVTDQFFKEYKALFDILQDDFKHQTKDNEWAHDYALQLLNRCMFLYFVQRKRWLGDDTEFLGSFWEAYQRTGQPKDSFFEKWLRVLFFEAFNNKFHGGHHHFPDNIKSALAIAPYLNGGLFADNELDSKHEFAFTDSRFKQVFTFLERYNFTIAEDSPLDQEVAVDPEMIGKVYESLVNVSTEADERGDAGIFYTPRTEIDLMCRLTLVDHLANHFGKEQKKLLYETVFAIEADEKVAADKAAAEAKLWSELDSHLRNITAVDPACGSGSFLVGMLHILDDLQQRADRQLEREESAFDRKKRIIGQSLYGVDVMDWACHVAELRLWLALVIDAEFTPAQLHARREPLLPHFTFKIRVGDSLVEEVGGVNLSHIHSARGIPAALKARITKLKNEKLKFYNNDRECQFNSVGQVKQEELRLFREILDTRFKNIEEEIQSLRRQVEGPEARQIGLLDGKVEQTTQQLDLAASEYKRKVENLKADLDRVAQSRLALKSANDVPFVWDIAFVEVFQDEKDGFDIVIGNPPYVRQENIADPRLARDEVTTENKKIYKAKLARSVYQAFPKFFGYKASGDTAAHKLNAMSDLFIYFYFHGLSLLNPKGAFCFITSNSWLDVGYGADLQEFLLKHCHVKAVLDNKVKRSFASADVNTVIVLLSPPNETREWGLDQTARFVMFKAPFEHVLTSSVFIDIETVDERKLENNYRVYASCQKQLLEEGLETEDEKKPNAKSKTALLSSAKYVGNKWGGKYLRAPDIYWTLLEKAKGKMVRLGSIAKVRRGFTTGCNDFFYISPETQSEWKIESQFLVPVLKTPREVEAIYIPPKNLTTKVFNCSLSKKELKGTNALAYIEWGEQQVSKGRQKQGAGIPWPELPTLRGRSFWYAMDTKKPGDFFCNRFFNDRFFFCYSDKVVEDQTFYSGTFLQRDLSPDFSMAILNCSIVYLTASLLGRVALGEGVLQYAVYEMEDLLVVDPWSLDKSLRSAAQKIFFQLKSRTIQRVETEMQQEDRRALDEIVFDCLGLTRKERNNVYEAVIESVAARLSKAGSLDSKTIGKRVDAVEKTRGIWAGLPESEDED